MTRALILSLVFFLFFYSSFAFGIDYSQWREPRPKVGLALGGGGAKGFAHIGVLKVLESNGIPIDMIAGTSIGAVAGGLYASGMNAAQLEALSNSVDWMRLFGVGYENEKFFEFTHQITYKLPLYVGKEESQFLQEGGVFSGEKILLFLRGETAGMQFSQLKIPFKATAVDLLSGNLKILDQGEVAIAMRSSFAIPGVFSPVRYNGTLLVDGGILNNLPTDAVRAMGAQIVIAVDLSSFEPQKEEDIKNILSVMTRFEDIQLRAITEKYKKAADIIIHPDVRGIGLLSFDKHLQAQKAGEEAALLKIEEIKSLIRRYPMPTLSTQ